MRKFILLSEKSWHDDMFVELSARSDESWKRIKFKNEFTVDTLNRIRPEKIFIPHWSYIIPKEIWINFDCVVFHMTDLPYGRGGSPLQNLIIRGHRETMISAIKVDNGIDTGDVYCKSHLSLEGTAHEIFNRSAPIMTEMIKRIIDEQLCTSPQIGTPVIFKRRKKEEGRLNQLSTLTKIYDYIRMLDAEGYPNAFIETEHLILKFKDAKVDSTNDLEIHANVVITKK